MSTETMQRLVDAARAVTSLALKGEKNAGTSPEADIRAVLALLPLIRTLATALAAHAAAPAAVMRLRCSRCGEAISSEVPADTVLRAFAECPECIAAAPAEPDWKALARRWRHFDLVIDAALAEADAREGPPEAGKGEYFEDGVKRPNGARLEYYLLETKPVINCPCVLLGRPTPNCALCHGTGLAKVPQ